MGISQKLWLTFGIMALCFVTSIAITWVFARQAGAGIHQITTQTLPLNTLSKDAFTTFKLMAVKYEQAGLIEDVERLNEADALAKQFDQQLEQLLASPLGHTLGDIASNWRRFFRQAPPLYRRWIVDSDYSQSVIEGIKTLREEIPEVEEKLASFAQASHSSVKDAMGDINARNHLINIINMVMLVIVVVLILVMILTIKGVRRSLASAWDALDQNQRSLNQLAENLASASRDNLDQANTVVDASRNMQSSVIQMAAAVEEMSQNVNSISSASEQLSLNMKHIAGSVEGLNKSMLGVDHQAQEGAIVAGEGTTKATATNQVMTTLGSAALAIGEVTNLIKRIADQTNLLALNATIEAASAGDAGKGFAVVAAEIKELASQSAHAADDIANRIRGIQAGSEEAVQATAAILKIINSINESARTITSAMSEQSETANAITCNIGESTSGVENIAEAISQLASGSTQASDNALEAARSSGDIVERITSMRQAVEETSRSAQQVAHSAEGLESVAKQLRALL